ncbi:MAG TPA: MFS transporter [Roseiflexaceae bacterium]|nr:MFS transporter [Roseiflexaceae bacterium]
MTVAARFGLIFALFYTGVGSFYTYLALYLKDIGLSGTQIGILLAVFPLGSFLTQPLWGFISDLYQIRRGILAITCFALGLVSLLFGLSDEYGWLLGCTIGLAILRSPIGPLSDALALEYLMGQNRRNDYGRLRLWGSVGFAVASMATGAFIIGGDLRLLLYLYIVTTVVMGLVALTLPAGHSTARMSWADGVAVLGANPTILPWLAGVALIGATLGIVNSYQIIYLDDINAPGWVSGLAFAIAGLLEAGLMGLAAPLIRRWGLRPIFLSGIALMVPRWMLYTVIVDPILVLPTQVLHSIGMLSLLVAGVLLIDQQLGAQWRATGQTLYQAALHGLGSAIGLLAAGVIYDQAGIVSVWWACVVAGTLGVIVLAWATQRPAAQFVQTRGV